MTASRNRLPAAIWDRLTALPNGPVPFPAAWDAALVSMCALIPTIYASTRYGWPPAIDKDELLAAFAQNEAQLAEAHVRWMKCALGRRNHRARRLAAEVYGR